MAKRRGWKNIARRNGLKKAYEWGWKFMAETSGWWNERRNNVGKSFPKNWLKIIAEEYVKEVKLNSLLLCPKIYRKKRKNVSEGKIKIKRQLKRKRKK